MSNSSNDASTIVLINRISFELNRYITLFIFLFGTIGNLLNILVLIQPTLRLNPSAIYFLGSSISGLGIILIGLPTRIIAGWISTDPSNTDSLLCKFRIFFLYSFRTASVWLLVLASIDRWLISSHQLVRRRFSNRHIAFRSVFIIYFCSILLWAESLFCYDINVQQAPLRCYGKTQICRIFNDLVYASSTVVIPSLFMLVFGFLTIHNIKQSRRTVIPSIALTLHQQQHKPKLIRRDQSSLTRMLAFQVILLTIFSLPQAIHQFYLTFTLQVEKSLLRQAAENFIVNFNFSLTYVGNGIPFYIYTLTGTIFRQTLFRLVRTTSRQIFDKIILPFKICFNFFLPKICSNV